MTTELNYRVLRSGEWPEGTNKLYIKTRIGYVQVKFEKTSAYASILENFDIRWFN